MYIYFDNNGALKEIITERPFRTGDSQRDKIYIYWDGEHTPAAGWVKYRKADGTTTTETQFSLTKVNKTLPTEPLRNLKYFSYEHTYIDGGTVKVGYPFYELTVPSAVLSSSTSEEIVPTANNMCVANVRFVFSDESIDNLGSIVFSVETSIGILTDDSIDETQYNYIIANLSQKFGLDTLGSLKVDELPETGETGIIYYVKIEDEEIYDVYFWNALTTAFVFLGTTSCGLYTTKEGQQFEEEINDRLDEQDQTIAGLGQLHPSGVDTAEHILEFNEDKGIWIGSDTGNWYYWDASQSEYVSGGTYQATQLNDKVFSSYKGVCYKGNIDGGNTSQLVMLAANGYNQSYTQMIYCKNDIEVRCSNDYQIKSVKCNENGTNLTITSFTTSSLTLLKGNYYIIVIAFINTNSNDILPEIMLSNLYFSNNDYEIQNRPFTTFNFSSNTLVVETKNNNIIGLNLGNLFDLGYKVNIYKQSSWDISNTQTGKELEINWQNNLYQFYLPKGIYKLFFRKYSGDTITDYTYSEITNNITTIDKIESEKFVHFSIDDCLFWTDLIDNENVYSSCFENLVLNNLKNLHDTYGFAFTLNCFCSSGTYDISNVPSKFKKEFSNNANWLKFAFHAEQQWSYYDTDKVAEITASYNKFVSAIYQMTGTYNCIDRITRLGFYMGTLNNVKAIRDCKCGIVGLLTRENDTSLSYYLDSDTNTYILNKNRYYDSDNQLMFIKSQTRIESISVAYDTLKQTYNETSNNDSRYIEFYTHEYNIVNDTTTLLNRMKQIGMFANINNYKFVFMENLLKL